MAIATRQGQARAAMGQLVFARQGYYGWFDLFADTRGQTLVFDNANDFGKHSSEDLLAGPGQSSYLVFSHYSDQIAFWRGAEPGELWVADVAFQTPKMILMDPEGVYVPRTVTGRSSPDQFIRIIWSPDDRYLFLFSLEEPKQSISVDLETGEIRAWYWSCDRLIVSPRSAKIATLCSVFDDNIRADKYAVLEWGGEAWFTNVLPGESFLQPTPDGAIFFEWSADGEHIAYFDPDDEEGRLHVADVRGTIRTYLVGSALFRKARVGDFMQYEVLTDNRPFRWSQDSSLLLVNGFGQPDRPCPRLEDKEYSTNLSLEWHCWQLLSLETGKVLWNEADVNVLLKSIDNEQDVAPLGTVDISFAPGAEALALYTTLDLPRIILVELRSFMPVVLSQYDRFEQIHWAGNQ